jgi:uncharacterized Rmd1/YagE family protein
MTMFAGRDAIRVRSLCVGADIDTRSLRKHSRLAALPLTLEAGRCGCAVVFRYGAVVLFQTDPREEAAFLDLLAPAIQRPAGRRISEEVELVLARDGREGVDGGRLGVAVFSLPVIQVVAEVLARSVVLERFEERLGGTFEALEPVAADLGSGHLTQGHHRLLLRRLGEVLLDRQDMVGRVAVSDKPDVLWDRPEFERLYARLTDEFEIAQRFEAVEAKLDLIGRTIQTAIGLIQSRRSLRVEWYIVVLIVVEIGLTLYGMFVRPD